LLPFDEELKRSTERLAFQKLDGSVRIKTELAQIAQLVGIAAVDAADSSALTDGEVTERGKIHVLDAAILRGNGRSVGIMRGMAQELIDAILELFRDRVL